MNTNRKEKKPLPAQSTPKVVKVRQPPLKRWTKASLTERDWNFVTFCAELEKTVSVLPDMKAPFLVSRAFHWELDRELGSGNGPFELRRELENELKPIDDPRECEIAIVRRDHPPVAVCIAEPQTWMLMPERKRDDLGEHVGLNEWPIAELAHYLPPDAVHVNRGTNEICALEIPWSVDDDDVVEAFRTWLQRRRGKHSDKAGRKHEWRTWFLNLSFYRLAIAGYTRAEVLKMHAKAQKKSKADNLSLQNYARARRFIRTQITWRFKTLLHHAKSMNQRYPEDGLGDWRQHFIKYRNP